MRPLIIALLSLTALGTAEAQTVTVTTANRFVRGFAYGFDYDFDGGKEAKDQTQTTSGEWISPVTADLKDYYGYQVGVGAAYQESQIDSDALSFTIDVSASIAGNHFSADSSGHGDYEVTFQVAKRMRYTIVAHADVPVGYNLASVRLINLATNGNVFQINADYGGNKNGQQSGWLDPGAYRLDAEAEVQAYGTHNNPDSQAGNTEGELRVFDAADFDLDGDVDPADWKAYKAAHIAGDPDADMDGDDDVDQADWNAFRLAWIAA